MFNSSCNYLSPGFPQELPKGLDLTATHLPPFPPTKFSEVKPDFVIPLLQNPLIVPHCSQAEAQIP